jgi:hypothetical protein
MEMIKLLEEHPKTATVIKQWLLERLLESMKDSSVPEEFKQLAREQGIDNDRVAGILNNTPRALFDVFDNHKVCIQISVDLQGTSPVFRYSFGDIVESIDYSSRKEADVAAIIEAFKLLEAKL